MNVEALTKATEEALNFLEAAARVKSERTTYGTIIKGGTKETAACKRASLDLTRALAELRKP